jgi:TorA maturation chaperone TorD
MSPLSVDETIFDQPANVARQTLYRFAALSFLDPQRGAWSCLASLRHDPLLKEAAALLRDSPQPPKRALGELAARHLDPQMVLDQLPSTPDEHNILYENTFGLLVSCPAPPHEIEYVNSKLDFQRSNGLADISGFYRAFGLTIAENFPERPDHIVLELEFMAFLQGLERRAAQDEVNSLNQRICHSAQQKFLSEHLAWWTPAFARLLCRENPHGFYAAAGRFLAALIPIERARLGVEPPGRPAAPMPIERPDTCEGCQLAAGSFEPIS